MQRQKAQKAKDIPLTDKETQAFESFFQDEIENQSREYTQELYKKMLKDIYPPELKQIFMDSILS